MNELIYTLGFLSIFHLIGGIAIGRTLHGWLRSGFSPDSLFLLVWGALFGGIPFFIGLGVFVGAGLWYLFIVQLGVFVGTILVAAFIPDWYLESFNSPHILMMLFGGVFMLVGIGVLVFTFASQPMGALFGGGVFVASGGFVFLMGLRSLLKQ